MSRNDRVLQASPREVWSVLADGWLYPLWVVGASRIRGVDASWPEAGSAIHHSVGIWPVMIDDRTVVLQAEVDRRLRLKARGWPLSEAEVEISLASAGTGTSVSIVEHPAAGPGVLVPDAVIDVGLRWRNTETLRRLAYIAENRPVAGA